VDKAALHIGAVAFIHRFSYDITNSVYLSPPRCQQRALLLNGGR